MEFLLKCSFVLTLWSSLYLSLSPSHKSANKNPFAAASGTPFDSYGYAVIIPVGDSADVSPKSGKALAACTASKNGMYSREYQ